MSSLLINEISIVIILLWVGFVSAISFMEAWIKFRAPGVTMQIGLGIGQLVFKALNKVELTFALIIGVFILLFPSNFSLEQSSWYILSLVLLLLQTFWLFPALDKRLKARLKNIPVPKSSKHFIYIGAELLKVTALMICVFHLFNSYH